MDCELLERFRNMPRAYPQNGCHLWLGNKMTGGYGRFKFKQKNYGAHRIAWEELYGSIPDDWCVCHRCDTPECVNPDHLFIGTHQDNQRDCTQKGRRAYGERNGRTTCPQRTARGERHGRAKLDAEKVREIRRLSGTQSQQSLADRFDVPQTAISAVQRHKTWKHVS